MQKKSGVTLITLAITIAVLAILTASLLVNVDNIMPESRKAKIYDEFKEIESLVEEYYITYGNYPVLNNEVYTKDEILALNTRNVSAKLEAAIRKNGEENSKFFVVDLEKLRITNSMLGNNVTQDDIYIASEEKITIYYPKGFEIGNEDIFTIEE